MRRQLSLRSRAEASSKRCGVRGGIGRCSDGNRRGGTVSVPIPFAKDSLMATSRSRSGASVELQPRRGTRWAALWVSPPVFCKTSSWTHSRLTDQSARRDHRFHGCRDVCHGSLLHVCCHGGGLTCPWARSDRTCRCDSRPTRLKSVSVPHVGKRLQRR